MLATLQVDVVVSVLQLLPITPFKGDFIGKAFIDVLPSRDRRPSMADISRRSTMIVGLLCYYTKFDKSQRYPYLLNRSQENLRYIETPELTVGFNVVISIVNDTADY